MAGRPRLLPFAGKQQSRTRLPRFRTPLGLALRAVIEERVLLASFSKTARRARRESPRTKHARVTLPPLPDPPGTGVLVKPGRGSHPEKLSAFSNQHSALYLPNRPTFAEPVNFQQRQKLKADR
jgi:hypothetical protein